MSWKTGLVSLALSMLAASAPWQPVTGQPYDGLHHRAVVAFCRWDLERFCDREEGGRISRLACLARHAESLSPPCYRALRVAATVDGCAGDFQRYCGNVPPGGGRVIACLRGNADRLSATCVRALRGPEPRASLSRREQTVPHERPLEAPGYRPDDPIR